MSGERAARLPLTLALAQLAADPDPAVNLDKALAAMRRARLNPLPRLRKLFPF